MWDVAETWNVAAEIEQLVVSIHRVALGQPVDPASPVDPAIPLAGLTEERDPRR